MNSENESNSIRDIFVSKTQTKQRSSHFFHIIKFIIIALLFFVIAVALVDGLIYKFEIKNMVVAFFCICAIAVIYYMKIDKEVDKEVIIKDVFVCPHCLKNVLLENMDKIKCPLCDGENLSFHNVLYGCPYCGDPIRLLNCPHCNQEIDLHSPYNIHELKEKRYE